MTFQLQLTPALVPVLSSCVELGLFNCEEVLARMPSGAPEYPVVVDLKDKLLDLLNSLLVMERLSGLPDIDPEAPF